MQKNDIYQRVKGLDERQRKLADLFSQFHSVCSSIAQDRTPHAWLPGLEVTALAKETNSFLATYAGLEILLEYVFAPTVEQRGRAVVTYSLVDRLRLQNAPVVLGKFAFKSNGETDIEAEGDHLYMDAGNEPMLILCYVIGEVAYAER
ncbi:MAG: hypothetical protein KIT86_00730 [Hydrogenophaga sp.]|jgi:hypothetical protein|uniref:hypothetical protein n=1 Tax=Hydrogenophaga sp. TaxID=1904254 RepID=UPI002631544A|nr:hypothetical protein [Hydrogenophaga sp.]MCW5668151.1 hypothetical protein [Hydrogenophaga sp.]